MRTRTPQHTAAEGQPALWGVPEAAPCTAESQHSPCEPVVPAVPAVAAPLEDVKQTPRSDLRCSSERLDAKHWSRPAAVTAAPIIRNASLEPRIGDRGGEHALSLPPSSELRREMRRRSNEASAVGARRHSLTLLDPAMAIDVAEHGIEVTADILDTASKLRDRLRGESEQAPAKTMRCSVQWHDTLDCLDREHHHMLHMRKHNALHAAQQPPHTSGRIAAAEWLVTAESLAESSEGGERVRYGAATKTARCSPRVQVCDATPPGGRVLPDEQPPLSSTGNKGTAELVEARGGARPEDSVALRQGSGKAPDKASDGSVTDGLRQWFGNGGVTGAPPLAEGIEQYLGELSRPFPWDEVDWNRCALQLSVQTGLDEIQCIADDRTASLPRPERCPACSQCRPGAPVHGSNLFSFMSMGQVWITSGGKLVGVVTDRALIEFCLDIEEH